MAGRRIDTGVPGRRHCSDSSVFSVHDCPQDCVHLKKHWQVFVDTVNVNLLDFRSTIHWA
jgi:hypothetical protein